MVCAKGHESEDADFCSVCGVRMAEPSGVQAVAPAAAPEACPDCGLAREPGSGIFCEFCRYNFSTGEHGELKPGETIHAAPAIPAPQTAREWEVLIEVDPALRAEESPEAPTAFQPVTVRLVAESSLIGRRSEKRGVFPEISLDLDDAVSHRHGLLNRRPDGSLIFRDIGSSNGTRLNGAEVQPMADVSLKAGDRLILGHWTRISIRPAPDK